MDSAWTTADSCTYGLITRSGAPGVKIDSTTTSMTSAKALLHFLEFDSAAPGFTNDLDIASTADVDESKFPAKFQSVLVQDD